ncbi:MAG: hypothetical protein LBG80_15825 [Bacteroidales bacterium]|jgi:hypothetical protein|nr:hypothetical protein [Bacteroidales bacterium]
MADEKNWKELALSRRLENKALKARLVEVIEGRDKWKSKSKKYQEENILLKKTIAMIKKNLLQIENI